MRTLDVEKEKLVTIRLFPCERSMRLVLAVRLFLHPQLTGEIAISAQYWCAFILSEMVCD